ncbi:MAG: hypothetical protein JKY54_05885 [Flavobacteriales bacterium]|nr:hypothetical protein [Flavobacteriales bacterium]
MKKNKEVIDERRAYIKRVVIDAQKKGVKTDYVVKRLSERLFLSESTIWKDLANAS